MDPRLMIGTQHRNLCCDGGPQPPRAPRTALLVHAIVAVLAILAGLASVALAGGALVDGRAYAPGFRVGSAASRAGQRTASARERGERRIESRDHRAAFGRADEARLEAVARQRIGLARPEGGQRGERLDEVLVDVAAEVGRVVRIDGRLQPGGEQLGEVVLGQACRPRTASGSTAGTPSARCPRARGARPAPAPRRSGRHGRCARHAARRARCGCIRAALPRRRGRRSAGPRPAPARRPARTSPAGGRARCCRGRRR